MASTSTGGPGGSRKPRESSEITRHRQSLSQSMAEGGRQGPSVQTVRVPAVGHRSDAAEADAEAARHLGLEGEGGVELASERSFARARNIG